MQSLRTRRPSASQKPSRQPTKLAKAPAKSRSGSTRKSRVDDKIKKRMSMRYADISAPTDASVPAVPSLPIGSFGLGTGGSGVGAGRGMDEEGVRDEREAREDPREGDMRALESETFDSDAFLKAKMANSTEAELVSMQSTLQSYKQDTNADLQRNVFKNYAEFMMISKEISTLENDMLELKESLSEWKSMPSLLHIDDSASALDRRRTQRSSVADLRMLYANQMQTLHSQIEGSSKFVPAMSGRHIVTEMEGIYSLNPATYKVENSVKFILLDDSVLVARKRARRTADRPNLVADKCWPLNDIMVLDTKDTATMTNVFKIRKDKELHVYRCELSTDKKTLLAQFRQIAEELAAKRRKEREGEHERRKTMWLGAGGDRRSFAFDLDASAAEWMSELGLRDGIGGSKEKADKDALWIGELTDSLTIAIALREWEKAVALVEEGQAKLSVTPSLEPKLNVLKSSLNTSLLQALSDPTNRKSTVVNLATLLSRLSSSMAARNAFLQSRAALTRKRIRTIRFEGHIQKYISELAMVVFTGIKHTVDWYLASFKENDATSWLIEWAKEQIGDYADMFRKQVFTSDVEEATVKECISISQTQNKKLLQDFGLDFHFLLDGLLVRDPSNTAAPPLTSSMKLKGAPQLATSDSIRQHPILSSAPTPRAPRMPRSPASPAPPPRSRDRPPSMATGPGFVSQDNRF